MKIAACLNKITSWQEIPATEKQAIPLCNTNYTKNGKAIGLVDTSDPEDEMTMVQIQILGYK